MRKKLLTLLFMGVCGLSFGQFTTGTVTLDAGSSMTIKIDTNATTATLTLVGPSAKWLGIGFNGFSMSEVTDMFIWNGSTNRDYTPSGGQSIPSADASQSWTITSDSAPGATRTVVATRALVSSGDYTFLNNNSTINIIFAQGSTTTLANHSSNPHSIISLPRTALGVEDFSLNATSIYPNPSNGVFNIQTKTNLSTINVYSQVGAFVKTIQNTEGLNNLEINLKDLQSGVYLLELQNDTDKSWKKIVIE